MIVGSQPETAIDLIRARMGRPWAWANSSDVTSVAEEPSVSGTCCAGGYGAFRQERGFQGGEAFRGRVGADAAVLIDHAVGRLDRHDFIVEAAGFLCLGRLAVAFHGEGFLRLTGELVLRSPDSRR